MSPPAPKAPPPQAFALSPMATRPAPTKALPHAPAPALSTSLDSKLERIATALERIVTFIAAREPQPQPQPKE